MGETRPLREIDWVADERIRVRRMWWGSFTCRDTEPSFTWLWWTAYCMDDRGRTRVYVLGQGASAALDARRFAHDAVRLDWDRAVAVWERRAGVRV